MKTINKKSLIAKMHSGKADELDISMIEFSPLNYRKYFREEDLEKFAEELKIHGIISPLTVRKLENGKCELVAGERRLRAAKIAELITVPVIIRVLSDEEVTEIQLAENLQRENPHPLDEANAVKLMQDKGKSIEEISLRLGKPKQYIYIRLKLLNLIEPIREMFFAEKISLQDALTIATISQEGQTQFFSEHCRNWKQKNFQLDNLSYYLRPYKFDLRNAPFDTKDKKLLPSTGACTGCPFNSATLKGLFPEYAKQAICSNTVCFNAKCSASLRISLKDGMREHCPVALLFNGEATPRIVELLNETEGTEALTRYDYNEITVLQKPEEPAKEDFMYEDDDDEDGKEVFDKKEFDAAMQEYKTELKEYEKNCKSGKYEKGLIENDGEFSLVYFNLDKPQRNEYGGNSNSRGTTMKMVQEAIKTNTATPELLDEAIEGIKQREIRAKEIDRNKVQLEVHKQVEEFACDMTTIKKLTDYDQVAARLLVYQSLDFNGREKVNQTLFKKVKGYGKDHAAKMVEALKGLTNPQYSYLIRLSLAGKSDSKYPDNDTGVALYKVAEAAGMDVKKIESDQKGKADARARRVKIRLTDLQKRKSKLKK